MLEQFKLEVTPLNLLLAGIVGYVAIKSFKGWQQVGKLVDSAIDAPLESLAETIVESNNPIIGAQIKIKPQYFIDINVSPQKLHAQALNVIQNGYPILFARVFEPDGTIKQRYDYIIGEDRHYSDEVLPV